MYRVLLPVDTNEDRARAQGAYVAGLPGDVGSVEVLLLHVFTGDDEITPNDFASRKEASRIGAVRRAEESLQEAGIEVSIFDESGDPAERIIEEANAHDVDSIVLGSQKRSPTGKALFGSVAQAVILDTNRPVVVTAPGED
jgi:nucleotide-binding universal stress UspA family protein